MAYSEQGYPLGAVEVIVTAMDPLARCGDSAGFFILDRLAELADEDLAELAAWLSVPKAAAKASPVIPAPTYEWAAITYGVDGREHEYDECDSREDAEDRAALHRGWWPDLTTRVCRRVKAGPWEDCHGTGVAEAEAIENAVGRWHDGDSDLPLHTYLGWTWEQYKRHVEDPSYCPPVSAPAAEAEVIPAPKCKHCGPYPKVRSCTFCGNTGIEPVAEVIPVAVLRERRERAALSIASCERGSDVANEQDRILVAVVLAALLDEHTHTKPQTNERTT